MAEDRQRSVWSRHAANWSSVGPPLRPSADDGERLLALLAPLLAGGRADVAVLGVTPEIVGLRWPAHVRLHAVDHSADMIATVWRAHPAIWSAVTRARWQALPLAARSIDAAVGDGSLNALGRLQDYAEMLGELVRVLRPGGALVLRCFLRPDRAETPETVVDAAMTGRIGGFDAFKWRLAMALASDAGFSVPVARIRESFDTLIPDRARLASATGWPRVRIDAIDAYRDAGTRYSFPTLAALAGACAGTFSIARAEYGAYELAERCPTLLLKPEASA